MAAADASRSMMPTGGSSGRSTAMRAMSFEPRGSRRCISPRRTEGARTESQSRSSSSLGAEGLLDRSPKARRVDGRKAIQVGLDPVEVRQGTSGIDEAAIDHCSYVFDVLPVAALDLGKRLRIQVEMVERDAPDVAHKFTAVLPTGRDGNEIRRRRELDVDPQRILERGNGA